MYSANLAETIMRFYPHYRWSAALVASLAFASAVHAQETWQPPQPPCEIRPGHGLVSDGINHLKNALENPAARRDQRLDQAFEVLTRAIRDRGQESNPAAWYYLGRYYTLTNKPLGADTAFRHAVALAPECEQDIAPYRASLGAEVLSSALRAWQEGKVDSASYYFDLAGGLNPDDAANPLYRSRMHSERGELDSAAYYALVGNKLAGDDPNYTRLRRRAQLDVARGYGRLVENEQALQRIAGRRVTRDTLLRNIRRDSTLLANLIAEWAGQHLRPNVQQAVSRDSTVLASRLGPAQAALPTALEALRRDSTAVDRATAPAIEAYEAYTADFPEDGVAALRLLTFYSAAGYEESMTALIAELGEIASLTDDQLLQVGIAVFNDAHPPHTVRLLEIISKRNPYNRGSLMVLCRAYIALQDGESLSSAADRLLELDPLNPQSVRMKAVAFDFAGQRDSALVYKARADSGIGWAVNIAQFLPTEESVIVNGTVANVSGRALPPMTLVIEFLSRDGAVLGSQTVEVPALQPRGQHSIAARGQVTGAVGWRYHRQQ